MLPRQRPGIVPDMASDTSSDSRVRTRTFLAERYRAGSTATTARRESTAAQRAATQLSSEGRPVTLLGCLLVPSDDTVFSLFGAASSADVAAVGERIAAPYDRISEGVPVTSLRVRNTTSAADRP